MNEKQKLRLECLRLAVESKVSPWEVATWARQYMDFVLNDLDIYPTPSEVERRIQKGAH